MNLNTKAKAFVPRKIVSEKMKDVLVQRSNGVLERFKKQNAWLFEYEPLENYEKVKNVVIDVKEKDD